jgi:hypothetical protein
MRDGVVTRKRCKPYDTNAKGIPIRKRVSDPAGAYAYAMIRWALITTRFSILYWVRNLITRC